jgi:Flp pilus assembly protein TadG
MSIRHRLSDSSGQSIIEFAVVLPILVVVALGVIDVGYALLNQHVVTKTTREGSNLISRDTTLQDAASAMKAMSSAPVNFDNGSKLIFSVIKRGATTGTSNYDKLVLYQRYEFGSSVTGSSTIKTKGAASFGAAPNYEASNSDNNTNLQITNLPANLVATRGGMLYVTEVYTRHIPITPIDRFGINLPKTLYSIAYF